jgi:GT2 family glycosyltransferase
MNKAPLVSICVVNFNGIRFLREFFESLYSQTYKNFEVIFVDNDSTDASVEYTENNYQKVKVIKNKKNSGYADGNNIAYSESKGDYLLIVNNDIVFKEDLIENLLYAFSDIKNLGVVQPMVRLYADQDKLDACGSFWTSTGFNYHLGIYKQFNLPIYNTSIQLYSVKGMCMMTKRSVIEEIGLFDPDFWCYFEETDFCHRALLAGYECWYYPKSYVFHHLGGSSNKNPNFQIQYHSFKNRLCSYLKNLEIINLLKILPVYFLMNLCWSFGKLLVGDIKNFKVPYKAVIWNIKNIQNTLIKRRKIQLELRRLSDYKALKRVKNNPRLYYYYCLIIGLDKYKD